MVVPSYSVLWATNVLTEIIILESADTIKRNEFFKPTLSKACNARKYTTEFDIEKRKTTYINIGFEKQEVFLMTHDHRFRSTQGVILVSQYAGCSPCFAVCSVLLASQ